MPRQMILQSGHLCRLGWNCIDGFGGVAVRIDCPDSVRADLKTLVDVNPFCLRCVIKCFLSVLISRNGRLHSLHVNGFSPVWIITWRGRKTCKL